MTNKTYIGISGVARSGKNLFCEISKKILTEKYGLKCSSYALADSLKSDCADFIKDKLGMNVFTENTDEKKIFRDMLVWYGCVKRKQSEGRYWTEMLQAQMEKDTSDVIFVTDIRYNFYPKDEVYWIKNDLEGCLIHVSKYTYGFPTEGRRIRKDVPKVWTEPANEHERENDPKVKAAANYRVEWEQVEPNGRSYEQLVCDPYLNSIVNEALDRRLTNWNYSI